jgi:integrase
MINRMITQWLPKYPERQAKQTALLIWWKKQCGHLLLADLTPSVIAECRDLLLNEITPRKQLRSPSTVNRYLSALGKALIITVKEWGWLEASPMPNVSKPAEGQGRERFLSTFEKDRLLEECQRSKNPHLYPIVAMALISGMRLGEITGLRWENVLFDQRKIVLCRTKNGDTRYIPMTDEAERIFRAISTFGIADAQLVFQSNQNKNGSRKISIREAFEHALKRAGITNFRFHDLRHTAASYMAMAGATQGELMAILGHRSPAMTQRYAHYSQDHLAQLLEKTCKAFSKSNDTKKEFSNG